MLALKREKGASSELEKALDIEESFLRQKSRAIWLREGERNSRFFQAGRRARKTILKLQDSDGLEVRGGQRSKLLQWTISLVFLVRIIMGQGLSLQLSTGSDLLKKEVSWIEGSQQRR